ncbi:hypothetical protein C8R46DRAFT_900195, partial [Mycena filopes]
SRKRPARTLGLTSSNASYLVPEAILKKFDDGWRTHVPLHLLTDKACSFSNHATTKELNDLYTMDGSTGTILTVAKEIAFEPELRLSFDEWFEAWTRLLELILKYLPVEHPLWVKHHKNILHRPNRKDNWALILEYDSRVRRQAVVTGIDPSIFHLDIWNSLEGEHIGKRAVATVRRELQLDGPSNRKGNTSERGQSQSSDRFQPYDNSKRQNANSSHSFRSDRKSRCFVCGSEERGHLARECRAHDLVNGKPAILSGRGRRDRDDHSYCFSFNGKTGCKRGNNCTQGEHWCTLCGERSGRHSAQDCPAL